MMMAAPISSVTADRMRCWLTAGYDGAWPQRTTSLRKRLRSLDRAAAAEADPIIDHGDWRAIAVREPSTRLAGCLLNPRRQPNPHSAR